MPFIPRMFSLSNDPSSGRKRFKTVVRKSLRLDYLIHQPGRTATGLPLDAPSTTTLQPTSDLTVLDLGLKTALSEQSLIAEAVVVEKEVEQESPDNSRRGKIIANIHEIEHQKGESNPGDAPIRRGSLASGVTSISGATSQCDRPPFLRFLHKNSSGDFVPDFGMEHIHDWCLPRTSSSYQPPYIIEPDESEIIPIALSPPPYYYSKFRLRNKNI